jgi:hypothetical protein
MNIRLVRQLSKHVMKNKLGERMSGLDKEVDVLSSGL